MASPGAAGSIRLDKLLWYLRFARSRSLAQALIAAGHIRLDGRPVTRASWAVPAGRTLARPAGARIGGLRLPSPPRPRGPAGDGPARSPALGATAPSPPSAAISGDGNAVSRDASDEPVE